MSGLRDPFGYNSLPGWSSTADQRTIKTVTTPLPRLSKWQSVALGFGSCFALIFTCQFLLAIASGDLKGYRARSIDLASASSVIAGVAVGVTAWRRLSEND